MYHCILGIGADFQTTSDFTDPFPSHWRRQQQGHQQPVAIPTHTRLCSLFRQQPAHRASCSEESDAMEMKTFSSPLEPRGFCAFQTTSEAELCPNRATGLLSKDKSLRLFVSSEKETSDAAQTVGGEEGTDCQHAAAVDEVCSGTNVLLLLGGKPLSSFSEISFWQTAFESLWPLWLQSERINFHQGASRWWSSQLLAALRSFLSAHRGKKIKPSHTCCKKIFYNVNKTWRIFKSQLAHRLQFLRGACWNTALLLFSSGQLISFQTAVADAALKIRTTSIPTSIPTNTTSILAP